MFINVGLAIVMQLLYEGLLRSIVKWRANEDVEKMSYRAARYAILLIVT